MMKKKLGGFLCALLFSGHVWAVDGVSIEMGNGDHADVARAGAVWNWDKQWFTDGDWLVAGFWEATVGTLKGRSSVGNNQTVTDFSVTPVFRLQQKNPSAIAPILKVRLVFI